ncbi:MAG TPA: glycosyltransferase family 9 protein [Thermodesulfobacteriota bacterium]|nr:glycosyltransferase family 9 protein [Thermodesulfobacteriota bacterium]
MSWKIEGLKRLDAVLGSISCSASRLIVSPRKEGQKESRRILVIRPGGIGDAVLLHPALAALRNHYGDYMIDMLAEKRNSGIFAGCPYIDNLLLYDRNPRDVLLGVIRGGYDIVIDTEQWHRMTSALAYLTRAPERVGFATNERAELYSRRVSYSHDDYEAVSFLNLVSALTGDEYRFDETKPFLPVTADSDGGIGKAVSNFRAGKKAVFGVFTGATVPERRWGADRFAELAAELSGEGMGIVLVGGAQDTGDASAFSRLQENGSLLNLVGKTSLRETASLISELDLFISGDTGLMHIAYGVGTPTVSLFGAGIQKKWAPRGDKNIVINRNEPCSPCTRFGYTPRCPYGVRCLTKISVEEVRDSVFELLRRTSHGRNVGK